jgi:hypothetical protein
MQVKTIKKIITRKLNEWLLTIDDEQLRKDVRENLLVSGGSITSLFQGLPVNDYDIYIKDMDVLIRLATYYCPKHVLDGRLRDVYLSRYNDVFQGPEGTDENLSEQVVRLKTLKPDQVKLDINSVGIKRELILDAEKEPLKYQVSFLSQNAISLTDDVQIVLRFHGDNEAIHKTFDFIHATNYFTFEKGLVTNTEALQCILTKQLKYQGSMYPLTSIIRIKKFLNRGWQINAGEMLKIMFQISELNLHDVQVLEEQLIGVDIAYFSNLITAIRERGDINLNMTSTMLNEMIDKIFNEYDGEVEDNEESNY